jgi:hypothetical protein
MGAKKALLLSDGSPITFIKPLGLCTQIYRRLKKINFSSHRGFGTAVGATARWLREIRENSKVF